MRREQWVETEEWARMEMQMYGYGEHLVLPEAELEAYTSSLLKRLGSYVRVNTATPMANDPKVRTLWWTWLHLDQDQSNFVLECDVDDVIGRSTKAMACHPALLKEMMAERSFLYYWSTGKWVEAVHNQTPKCVKSVPRETTLKLFHEMHTDPKYARHQNLAICYLDNLDDVLSYVDGSGITVISHTPDRLILKTPNGQAQVLREQWLWFNGMEFRHGGLKALMDVRLKATHPRQAPGFWVKPTKPVTDVLPSICPEINYA